MLLYRTRENSRLVTIATSVVQGKPNEIINVVPLLYLTNILAYPNSQIPFAQPYPSGRSFVERR